MDDGVLAHSGGACTESYPIIAGIPRLLAGTGRAGVALAYGAWSERTSMRRALARRWREHSTDDPQGPIVRGFDDEWSRFPAVRTKDARALFEAYFDIVPAELFNPTALVLDAGCGAGRWALEVAARGPRVIALDLGRSIEIAARNAAPSGRIACVQGDVRSLPLADGIVDWAYCLGVLHHVTAPATALRSVARATRRDGALLIYLYYALDFRGPAYRALFRAVDAVRRRTAALPRSVTVAFAATVAIAVYWPLARASRMLHRAGLHNIADGVPLAFYRDRAFMTMVNDSLDRFGTSLERRYTRAEVVALLAEAGAREVVVSPNPPYWHALGRWASDDATTAVR